MTDSIPMARRSIDTYERLIHEFERIRQNDFIPRENLDYMKNALSRVGNPHESMGKIIHVTGTNGKGSVTWKIARCLEAKGLSVGLYVSPHLNKYNERISINGEHISDEEMVYFANRVFTALRTTDIRLGMVGTMVCIAFLFFKERYVEYSVVEGGIGARLDHVNVVTPKLSIITSIGLDHATMIGPTIEDITRDKAYCIKPRQPIIVGHQISTIPSVFDIISHAADAKKSRLVIGTSSTTKSYEQENRATALAALQTLFGTDYYPEEDPIKSSPPGRYHTVTLAGREGPLSFRKIFGQNNVIFDVGHNEPAFESLLQRLSRQSIFIFALARSKDIEAIARTLMESDKVKHIYLVDIDNPEILPSKDTLNVFREEGLPVTHAPGAISEALKFIGAQIYDQADVGIVVSGSFKTVHCVSEAVGIDLPRIQNIPLSPGTPIAIPF